MTYSSLYLLSLCGGRGGRGEEKGGDNLVRKFFFKTKPIVDVKCNRRQAKCSACELQLEVLPVLRGVHMYVYTTVPRTLCQSSC